MKRVTFDERGFIQRICADQEVEVDIVSQHIPRDRVCRRGSTLVGKRHVDEEIKDRLVDQPGAATPRCALRRLPHGPGTEPDPVLEPSRRSGMRLRKTRL